MWSVEATGQVSVWLVHPFHCSPSWLMSRLKLHRTKFNGYLVRLLSVSCSPSWCCPEDTYNVWVYRSVTDWRTNYSGTLVNTKGFGLKAGIMHTSCQSRGCTVWSLCWSIEVTIDWYQTLWHQGLKQSWDKKVKMLTKETTKKVISKINYSFLFFLVQTVKKEFVFLRFESSHGLGFSRYEKKNELDTDYFIVSPEICTQTTSLSLRRF